MPSSLSTTPSDCNYLRIWRHFLWKDPHYARNESPPWCHSSSGRGKLSCSIHTHYVYNSALQAMFLQKAALQRSSVELAVSYMEIYKDEVYDLLVNRESVRCISSRLCNIDAQLICFLLNPPFRHPSFPSVKMMSGKYSLPT